MSPAEQAHVGAHEISLNTILISLLINTCKMHYSLLLTNTTTITDYSMHT